MSDFDEQIEQDGLIEEKLNRAFYSTFHSIEGSVTLKDLLSQFYKKTSLSEDADPNKILINEGKRFVIIYILSRMEAVSKQEED